MYPSTDELPLAGITLVAVDDDPASLKFVSTILTRYGAIVHAAESGERAIPLLTRFRPSILVTDLSMPVMDGFTLAREAREIVPDIRVIATSAYTETDYLLDAIRNAFDDYLVKPVRKEHLVWRIRRCHETVLAKRNAREEAQRFRVVVESLHEPLMLIDDQFRVILHNCAANELFLVNKGQWCYRSQGREMPCDDCPVVDSRRSGEKLTVTRTFMTSNGKRTFEITVSPFPDHAGHDFSLVVMHDVTRQKEFEEILSNVARGVSAETGESFFMSLASFLHKATGMDLVMIAELQEGRLLTHGVSYLGTLLPNFDFLVDGTPCGRAIEEGMVIYNGTLGEHFPEASPAGIRMESYCGIGLTASEGEPIGVLCTFSEERISNERLLTDLLTIFGARAAAEIERLRQERKIESLALHDPLTGLANRRLLLERLDMVRGESARRGKPFALIMIDLDDFKEINDRFGHGEGDHLLVSVAMVIRGVFRRSTDTVCRLGGDEFCVVVSEIESIESLRERLDELMRRLAETESPRRVSASIGVVVSCGEEGTIDSLMDRVDRAMYRSKESGKNRITLGSRDDRPLA